MISCNTVDDAV